MMPASRHPGEGLAIAFNPFAGSSGRLKSAVGTPALGQPAPTVYGATATAAGITGFKITPTVEDGGGYTHYESPASAAGVLATEQAQGGVGKWTAQVSGHYDGDATSSDERFPIGGFVVADFVFSKASTYGRYGAKAKVKSYEEAFDHKANLVGFTATLEGHGLLPDPSIPS